MYGSHYYYQLFFIHNFNTNKPVILLHSHKGLTIATYMSAFLKLLPAFGSVYYFVCVLVSKLQYVSIFVSVVTSMYSLSTI